MKKYKLNTCAFVFKVKEHKTFKKYMMNYIKQQPNNRLVEQDDDITNTDWDDCNNFNKPYANRFCKFIDPYLTEASAELHTLRFRIKSVWYQQYQKESKHQWHYHAGCNWSAVYFLQLPKNTGTQLFDIIENKIVDNIKLNEGDLFLFPANLLHRSPPNMTDETKTIISFNIDFEQMGKHDG